MTKLEEYKIRRIYMQTSIIISAEALRDIEKWSEEDSKQKEAKLLDRELEKLYTDLGGEA